MLILFSSLKFSDFMKKITLLFALLLGFVAFAQNSNDTTFVNTDEVDLDYFGSFDAPVDFPDGSQSYRKIIMTLTFGQYDCDPGTQYCHQWDYTTDIQLLDDGDMYELGRFITPFATSGWSRFGSDWKQPYVFDVTDFYPLLQGQKEVRIRYSGYSGGFTAKIEFAFVEGTPEREVLGIEPVYQVEHAYGDPNDPFNDYLTTFSDTPPAGTQDAEMKVIVTGHGSDDTEQCCEFSSHYYDVLLNNSQIDRIDIWRNDCGENNLYPQGGTWIYDRSNWCPGAKVEPIYHDLAVSPGTSYDLDVQFEAYTGSGDLGNYSYNAVVFYYGDTNNNVDAAISDIIAPTNDPNHYRSNPSGSVSKIKVSNTGNTAITSIGFSYGVEGHGQETYSWSGNLPAQGDMTITLPELQALTDISFNGEEDAQKFEVEITEVNGQADDEPNNNYRSAEFIPAPFWPENIVVEMTTGSKVENGYLYNSGPSDVSWEILDMDGNVVASRTDAQVNSEYSDNIEFPESGFYKLKIVNENCFGLHWWPYDGAQGYHPGYFKITNSNGTNLPMHNYIYSGTQHDDWGCSYIQNFAVDVTTAGVDKVASSSFDVYPNPAKDFVHIDLTGKTIPPYEVSLVNLQGKRVYQTIVKEDHIQIPVSQFQGGLYMLILKDNLGSTQVGKVIIAQ